MEFQNGKLLIATPELMDSNFFRTVSFLFHHDRTGAGGVILNRPSNITFGDVWSDLLPERYSDWPIHVGGPVEGPLMGLHDSILGKLEQQVMPGAALTVTQEALRDILEQEPESIKVFSGYAGWGPGQLELEIQRGGWLTLDCHASDVFETPEEIWRSACAKFGNQIMFRGSELPLGRVDPLAN